MPQLSITLPFADGTYTFALYGPQINEIQRKCGVGMGAVLGRLMTGIYMDGEKNLFADPLSGIWYDVDITEVLRQSLIGGGKGLVDGQTIEVTPALANDLITNYVLPLPRKPSWLIAAAVVTALIEGYEPPRPPKPAGRSRRTRKAESTTPSS